MFRSGLLLATAIVVLACGFAGEARAEDSGSIGTEEWRTLLLQHTDDFANARLDYRQAERVLKAGDPVRARQLLEQASEEDPRFYQPHNRLAWLDLNAGRSTVLGEMLDATYDRWSGYRNQALASANALIGLDLVIGVFLIWTTALFLVRYLPYLHHRVAQSVLVENHRARFARWLWPAILAPFAVALSWGLLPWLALSIVVVWIHADRRPRAVLAVALLVLIAQGAWPRGTGEADVDRVVPEPQPKSFRRKKFEFWHIHGLRRGRLPDLRRIPGIAP